MTIRVLIADDSSLVREVLREVLARAGDLEVVGEAGDGLQAVRLCRELQPDVITLDVLMPMLSGFDAIARLQADRPTPVVVVADDPSGDLVAQALARGAREVLLKPPEGFDDAAAQALYECVRRAAAAGRGPPAPAPGPAPALALPARRPRVLGIVGSWGAPSLLRSLLAALPAGYPIPIAVVQHTATGFTAALASWLDEATPLTVRLAGAGDRLEPGRVLVAPDHAHLEFDAAGVARLSAGAPVAGHRPSGNVLLRSLAAGFRARAAALVLTGMGRDAAEGVAAIDAAGGLVLVEDPATAAVAGMPEAARDYARRAHVIATDALGETMRKLGGQR